MLNWLKFFPLSIEQDRNKKPSEIRGPYFRKLRENKWFLNDSTFYFRAPWSNPIFSIDGSGSTLHSIHPGRTNILNAHLQRIYSGSDGPPSFWNLDLFYENTWYFVGPWFAGHEARLKASGILVSVRKGSSFAGTNFFHPRVFESAVTNYFDNTYGYSRSGKRPYYCGPMDWHVLPLSPNIQAIACDIHFIANGGKENPALLRFVCFPISPQQFILISYDFLGTEIFRDDVRAKPLLALCDSIIHSMRLEVGENTQAEWDTVKATCPDMALTETFGELPWPLYKEKARKKPKEVDITPNKEPKAVPFKQ